MPISFLQSPPDAPKVVVPPVQVAIVGTGDGGTVVTPPGEPNVHYTFVAPLLAIGVRFANVFFVSLVGLLTAAVTPAGGRLLYTSDFWHLILTCANLSLPVAGLGLVKDLVTVFGKLEQKYPLATGSI